MEPLRQSNALRFGERRLHNPLTHHHRSPLANRRQKNGGSKSCTGRNKRRWSHRRVFGRAELRQLLRTLTQGRRWRADRTTLHRSLPWKLL